MMCATYFLVLALFSQFDLIWTNIVLGNTLPFTPIRKLDFQTYTPINIDTKDVKSIITTPLRFNYAIIEKAKLINTGYTVEVVIDQPFTRTSLTGGILDQNIYLFKKIEFYWTDNPISTGFTTINGQQGTPLEAVLVFYNKIYGTFENAKNYRDGIVELIIRIDVYDGVPPNPLFAAFELAARKIKTPGKYISILNLLAYIPYSVFAPGTPYYAYPATYTDIDGQKYYSTTTIVVPRHFLHYISRDQFDRTFKTLIGIDGKPLINVLSRKPAGRRPIVYTSGLFEIPILI